MRLRNWLFFYGERMTNELIRLSMINLHSLLRWQDEIGDDFDVCAGTGNVAGDHPQEEQEGRGNRRCRQVQQGDKYTKPPFRSSNDQYLC